MDFVGNVSELTHRWKSSTLCHLAVSSCLCNVGVHACVRACVCLHISSPNVQAYGPPVTVEMPLMLHGPESLYCVQLSFRDALMALPVSTIILLFLSSWWHCTMKEWDYSSNVQERWGRLSLCGYLYTAVIYYQCSQFCWQPNVRLHAAESF